MTIRQIDYDRFPELLILEVSDNNVLGVDHRTTNARNVDCERLSETKNNKEVCDDIIQRTRQ